MDSTLHPLDYQALAREALDGGFTQALDGFRPTSGYVVSTRKDAEASVYLTTTFEPVPRNLERVIADALYHFVVRNGHDLRHGYLLGAWRDDDEDRVVLDLVQVFEDRRDALSAALANGQDAIYDVAARAEIWVAPAFEVIREGRYDSAADQLEWLDAQRDAELARWDDDPNPYHGDYSEE